MDNKYRRNNRLRLVGFGLFPLLILIVFLGFVGVRTARISQLRNDVEKALGQKDNYVRFKALEELVELGEPLNNIELGEVNLRGANLSRANLQKAQYTDNSTSQKTCEFLFKQYPCPTTFPKDFDPKKAEMKLVKQ